MIPELETERLRLRGHRIEDFSEYKKMWADPVVTRFIGGQPSSEQDTWGRVLKYAGHWRLMGYGYWAVEEKSTGQFIGDVGFSDFKREMTPSIQGTPELGWALMTHVHGKGYATEALKAAVAWGDKNLDSKRTVCIINPDNLASLRVADKIGYKQVQNANYKGETVILFERFRP